MFVNILTIKDIKPYLAQELENLFYDDDEISALARIIVKTIFKGAGLHQIYNSSLQLNGRQVTSVRELTGELKSGKPYQYVLGETEFLGYTIRVRPGVLIPRPETEELVDLIIRENKGFTARIADFGTGSGCIAIALASGLPGSKVTGYDNSPEALKISRENALANKADVTFQHLDILHHGMVSPGPAELIVSNPPYVLKSEKSKMRINVLDFEPPEALFVDDEDPLIYYRKILELSSVMLPVKGRIYFEINESMGNKMEELLTESGIREVHIIKDLSNKDRFIKAVKS